MSDNKINCEYFKRKMQDFLMDALSAEERALFRKHIEECNDCFQLLITEEPSLLFTRLSKQQIPLSFWRGFNTAVKDGISKRQLAPGWFWLFRRRSLQAALAAALVFIFTAVAGIYFAPKFISFVMQEEAPKLSLEIPSQQVQKIEQLRAYFPTIEELENQDARLYKFNVEEGLEVVMIFDENINGEK